jgi:hypothetical protein
MLTTLTAKLKLATTPEQSAALRATQLAYRDGLNRVSQYAFAHGKTSSRRRLQRDLYPEVRSQCALPAQLACSVFRQVGATYQDWMATGQLSDAPDVTDREAKAARLSGYAELRWSLVTSLFPSRGIESLTVKKAGVHSSTHNPG